ncbi:ABC transporter permease [Chloroflexota bacterium]
MTAFYKLLIANFILFFRDRTALFFTFAFPLLFMIIFGFVFSNPESVSYDIGLVSNDDSELGVTISQTIYQIPIFKVNEGDLNDTLEQLSNGDIRAVILIPPDLQSNVANGKLADITLYYDPSQTTSSQVIIPVVNELINEMNLQLTQEPVPLRLIEESIQSKDLRNIDYLVPGILAMSVLFLGLFGALPMVEWREKQVLKRFSATPLNRFTVVASQIIYRLVLAVAQASIIIIVAGLVFNVEVVGNWFMLFGLVILGTLTMVSIGYLAVSRARTVEGAMPIVQLIQFPMLFLSGIFFPVDFMPSFMRPLVAAMPITYLGDALRQVMVDTSPLHPIPMDVAILTGWLVVSIVLTIRFFRWE